MPEIPAVVAGEPVESAWGNLVSSRTIQHYEDQTALEASQPFPDLGEVVWLDDPGILKVWDGSAWLPLGDKSQPLSTFQQVERASSGMAQWRRPGAGWVTHQILGDGGYQVDIEDGAGDGLIVLQLKRSSQELALLNNRMGLAGGAFTGGLRPGVAVPWSTAILEIGDIGSVGTQGSFAVEMVGNYLRTGGGYVGLGANGQNGAGRVTILPVGRVEIGAVDAFAGSQFGSQLDVTQTYTNPKNIVRLTGNTGNRIHYVTGSGGTLTPDFDAVWDASSGPVPSDNQLYRGSPVVMAEDDPDLDLADSQVQLTAATAGDIIDDITVHSIMQDGKMGAVMTSPTWDQGGSVRPLVAALVRKVQDLEARLAALEGA